PTPLGGGGFESSTFKARSDSEDTSGGGSGTVQEARLVRRPGGEGYANVVEAVRQPFLRIHKERPLPPPGETHPHPGPKWTIESVEKVTLEIPAGAAKSSEDGSPPVPEAVL